MVMLGNESIEQIEKRIGIDFSDDVREFMKKSHQAKAEGVKNGEWHCFDIPFNLLCGDMETAKKIYYDVKDRSSECKEQLQFSTVTD